MTFEQGFDEWPDEAIAETVMMPNGVRILFVVRTPGKEWTVETLDDSGEPSGVVIARGYGWLDLMPIYPYRVLKTREGYLFEHYRRGGL